MATCAPCLEVGEKCFWRDVGVKNLCVSEFLHPHILNNGDNEMHSLLPLRLVGAAVVPLGFVRRFHACADDGRGIFINRRVVGAKLCGLVKLCAIARCVFCH